MSIEGKCNFEEDLVTLITKMNYSISDIDNPVFINFFKQYTLFSLSSASYYKKSIVPKVFNKKMQVLNEYLQEKDFFILADSSIDAQRRNILIIMIGACYKDKPSEIYMLDLKATTSSKAENYANEILDSLNQFFGISYNKENFKLLITDQAPNMMKTGEILKSLFSSLKHISCLAHLIHNVCERIRRKTKLVDDYTVIFKRLLTKNKKNQDLFKEITGLSIPKFPSLIRWGTWLEFTKFLYDNYLVLGTFLIHYDKINHSNYYEKFNGQDFEKQIEFCYDYIWIVDVIFQIQEKGKSLKEQVNCFKNFKNRITDYDLLTYIDLSLKKNTDVEFFLNYNQLRAKNEDKIYNYVPLTTCENKRCFSRYGLIFDESRQSLTVENAKRLLFLYFNKNL